MTAISSWLWVVLQLIVITNAHGEIFENNFEKESLSALHETIKSEVDNANLAMSKSQNQSLITFARKIIDDYSSIDGQSPYWQFKNNLPNQQMSIAHSLAASGHEQGLMLSKLQGSDFDKAYIQNELEHHILMSGMLEVSMMPNIKSQNIKNYSLNCLLLFKKNLETIRASLVDAQNNQIAPINNVTRKLYAPPPRAND